MSLCLLVEIRCFGDGSGAGELALTIDETAKVQLLVFAMEAIANGAVTGAADEPVAKAAVVVSLSPY